MDWMVAGIIVVIGAGLALSRSSYMVDYVLVVYVFNRGLRRVLDWYAGAFNPLSPVSLAPLVVTGLMLLPLCSGSGCCRSPRGRFFTVFLVRSDMASSLDLSA